MENIKATAWTFLVEHHLDTFPIDVLALNKLSVAFKIRSYEEAKNLIKALGLEEYADSHMGFTISEQGITTICYDHKLSFSNKYFVIAHEIGHVALKHTTDGYLLGKNSNAEKQNEQEKEADVFALALLAPAPVLAEMQICTPSEISRITRLPIKKAEEAAIEIMNEDITKKTGLEITLINNFRTSILMYAPPLILSAFATEEREGKKASPLSASILSILCFTIGVGFGIGAALNTLLQAQNQVAIVTAASVSTPEQANTSPNKSVTVLNAPSTRLQNHDANMAVTVYITKTGTKYHLPDCPHTVTKNNLRELTRDQAEQEGYEPCKTCRPNE